MTMISTRSSISPLKLRSEENLLLFYMELYKDLCDSGLTHIMYILDNKATHVINKLFKQVT